MANDRYRSYVIRVRRKGGAGSGPTRLDVEDLIEGGRGTVSGDPAASFAESLERLVDPASRPLPPPAPSPDDPSSRSAS